MKNARFVLFICLFTSAFMSFGQQPKVVYCQIIAIGNGSLFSNSVSLQFTIGNKMKLYEDKIMKDDTGKKIKINGMIDALNFMAKHGWELDQTLAVSASTGSSLAMAYHYVLKKNFADLEEDVKSEFLKD